MMRKISLMAATIVCMGVFGLGPILPSTAVQAGIISFDSLDAAAGPITVTNQFSAIGVIFEDLFIRDVSGVGFYETGPASGAHTPPNVGILNNEIPFNLLITATFVVPPSGMPGVTDQVEVVAFDTEVGSVLATMKAFDIDNNVIDSVTVLAPGANRATIGVSGSGIHRVTLETDVDGASFDNFTFGEITALPEPSSATMFAGILTGVAVVSRRCRTRRRSRRP